MRFNFIIALALLPVGFPAAAEHRFEPASFKISFFADGVLVRTSMLDETRREDRFVQSSGTPVAVACTAEEGATCPRMWPAYPTIKLAIDNVGLTITESLQFKGVARMGAPGVAMVTTQAIRYVVLSTIGQQERIDLGHVLQEVKTSSYSLVVERMAAPR